DYAGRSRWVAALWNYTGPGCVEGSVAAAPPQRWRPITGQALLRLWRCARMRLLARPGLLLLAVVIVTPAACRKATPPPDPTNTPRPAPPPPPARPTLAPTPRGPGATPPLPQGLQLRAEPAVLRVSPGGSARVKLVAVRAGYQGPVSIELGDLPGQVT